MADNLADDFNGAAVGTANRTFQGGPLAGATITPTPSQNEIQDATETASGSSSTSNGNLPWAVVLLPTTAAGHSGIGQNKHGLVEESWVFGFFADGDNCQQPVIVGVVPRGQSTSGTNNLEDSYGQNRSNTPQNTPSSSQTGANTGTTSTASTRNSRLPFANQSKAIQLGFEVLMRPPTNFTKEQVAGILGNLIIESNLNPNAVAKGDNKKSRVQQDSIGIAQWNDVRAQGLKNFAASKGKDWTDLQTQFEYIGYELLNSESKSLRELKNSYDPISAADSFCLYERPKGYNNTFGCDQVPSIKQRRKEAQKVYEQVDLLQKSPIRGAGVAGER